MDKRCGSFLHSRLVEITGKGKVNWSYTVEDARGEEKICALGIRLTKWVTKHGFALNINNELKCFSHVHPCGITNSGVTSMSRLMGHTVRIDDVMLCLTRHCAQVFNIDMKLESPARLYKYYVV